MLRMKARDTDILFVPGYGGSGPGHWQTRWEERLSTGRRVNMTDWDDERPQQWIDAIATAVNEAEKPVVLVAHSLGVLASVAAIPKFRKSTVGAFLVAPPDLGGEHELPGGLRDFGDVGLGPLPFPSILVASRNDPYCDFAIAEELGGAWGSLFTDAGEAGHINADAGFGPWPEGSLTFAKFISSL